MAWAYKYYFNGIKLHVDEAAVNANFWLSEILENNPKRGGIVIFREEPPKGTPRSIYNNASVNHHRIRQKLELKGHGKIEVEHRQNRLGKFCFSFCRRELSSSHFNWGVLCNSSIQEQSLAYEFGSFYEQTVII